MNPIYGDPPSPRLPPPSLTVRVQTLDKLVLVLHLSPLASVLHLKDAIYKRLDLEPQNQTLLWRGKRLRNNQALSALDLVNGPPIHLVAQQSPGVQGPPSRPDLDTDVISGVLRTLQETAAQRTEGKLAALQSRALGFWVLEKESREVVRQNLLTVAGLEAARAHPAASPPDPADPNPTFDPEKRELSMGQWVDAQDTLGQWLEAEVIGVDQSKVLIHYSGWEQRWDEWLDKSSPRIAAFKTHTVQPPRTYYLSPVPSTEPNGYTNSLDGPPASRTQELLKDAAAQLKSTAGHLRDLLALISKAAEAKAPATLHGASIKLESAVKPQGRNFNEEAKIAKDNKSHFSLKFGDSEPLTNSLRDDARSVKMGGDGTHFSHKQPKVQSTMATSPKSIKSIKSQLSSRYGFDHEDGYFQEAHEIIPEDLNQEISFDLDKEKNSLRTNRFYDGSVNERGAEADGERVQRELDLRASQLAPVMDRLGRALVDLAPHVATVGAGEAAEKEERLQGQTIPPNLLGLFGRSGGGESGRSQDEYAENGLMYKTAVRFQVPVMLTPGELMAVTSAHPFFAPDNNVQLSLHAVIREDRGKEGE